MLLSTQQVEFLPAVLFIIFSKELPTESGVIVKSADVCQHAAKLTEADLPRSCINRQRSLTHH